jgi:hypothetical protein
VHDVGKSDSLRAVLRARALQNAKKISSEQSVMKTIDGRNKIFPHSSTQQKHF